MESKKSKKKPTKRWSNFLKVLIFMGTIAIIAYLLPTHESFKYQFELGKPWSYDLITATFDFPIYKDEIQIRHEKKVALKRLIPFYNVDTTLVTKQFDHFKKDCFNPLYEGTYIEVVAWKHWRNLYETGIISTDQLQKLSDENIQEIHLVFPDKTVYKRNVDKLLTPQSAYEKFTNASIANINLYNSNYI